MILCDKCKQRPATVHFTEIVNNNKRQLNLCEVCAKEEQLIGSFGASPQPNLHNFLVGLFAPGGVEAAQLHCPECGLTHRKFASNGLLGCGHCYQEFEDRIEPMVRRIQGTGVHTGKVPARSHGRYRLVREIDQLKKTLREAVAREEFERAAELRDQIRELERKLERGGTDGDVKGDAE